MPLKEASPGGTAAATPSVHCSSAAAAAAAAATRALSLAWAQATALGSVSGEGVVAFKQCMERPGADYDTCKHLL